MAQPSLMVAALLAAAVAAPAFAADGDATLRSVSGKVMSSDGGDFAPAARGTLLAPGDRLMLAEGAVAVVAFDDDCQRRYSEAGVYVVERSCEPAAGPSYKAAGIIAGGLAVALALGSGGGGSDSPPPVSR
jgi:hypothetical protein